MAWGDLTDPTTSWFDVPVIGSHVAKIGRVIDLWSDPCAPTPELWVYAFWQAAPTAIFTPLKPELWDVDIPGHHPRGKKGKRGIIAALARYSDSIVSVPIPRWGVFRAFELSEFIGWWLFLADVAEDAAINWMSLAYEYQGCTSGTEPHAYNTIDNDVMFMPASGQTDINIWEIQEQDRVSGNSTWMQSFVDGEYRASVDFTAAPHPTFVPAGSIFAADLYDMDSGKVLTSTESATAPQDSSLIRTQRRFRAVNGPGPRLAVRIYGTEGFVLFNQGNFSLRTGVGKNLGIDP